MAETADVVIIGGGIVGSSVAYHLTDLGCTNVLIVERGAQQGLGSTAKSAGGVRAQFATPVNIEMSRYAIDFFSRFEELTGNTAQYRPHGYLFIATRPAHLEYLENNRRIQAAHGLTNVQAVTRDDILDIIPQINSRDILGGSFCPTDGFVDPYSVMVGFAGRARERGARLLLDTEVTGLDIDGGKVKGVHTSRGYVATPTVVNAAGPWAKLVAAMAGVQLPVEPLRRKLVHTQAFDGIPARLPMVIDMTDGFHFRREGAGVLLAWHDGRDEFTFDMTFDDEFIERILTRAVERVPAFADAEVNPRRCWAGLYEVTPDHHAIIGPATEVAGFYLVNGFSGHGVMHSPASGRVAAEWILYGEPRTIDTRPLTIERFRTGQLLHETAVL
ncbi:MAG TPA: FAD-binding oxidoreductase [Blastocatellia bacterium]|nr:FAD-binding oxidoreductase [Blastocatellia bacterium]